MTRAAIELDDVRVTQVLWGALTNRTPASVSKEAKKPNFPPLGSDGRRSLKECIRWREGRLLREAGPAPHEELSLAKARLANVQADLAEFKRLEASGILVRREDVDDQQREDAEIMKNDLLLTLPKQAAVEMCDRKLTTAQVMEVIARLCRSTLQRWTDAAEVEK